MDDRQRRRDKALRGWMGSQKHEKSREEKRRIKEARRQAGKRGRAKAPTDDDAPTRESMASPRTTPSDWRRERESKILSVEAESETAQVVGVHRTEVELEFEGQFHRARVARTSETLVVGDEVRVRRAAERLLVVQRNPRRSVLAREDPGQEGQGKVIVANVDVGVLVLSAHPFRPQLAPRVVAAMGRGKITAWVCINKIDLLSSDEEAACRKSLEDLAQSGVPIFMASAQTGAGVAALRSSMSGRTAVLVGHSGVGKSALANALAPGSKQLLGRVRPGDGKGRHTTTSSSVIRLDADTRLIDTPGVRSFGLGEVDEEDRERAFPDIEALAQQCRFRDCRHLAEPGCEVRAAMQLGSLDQGRLAAYQRFRG